MALMMTGGQHHRVMADSSWRNPMKPWDVSSPSESEDRVDLQPDADLPALEHDTEQPTPWAPEGAIINSQTANSTTVTWIDFGDPPVPK